MHLSDALLSPGVAGIFWAASAVALVQASRRLRIEAREQGRAQACEQRVPLMGVLGAFLFAAQMINFSIPGTGSSGHLAGGLLLAMLLGPHAGFLVVASVLVVQAVFFADGGLLALGCNIFNLGVVPAYLVYPWLRKVIQQSRSLRARGIWTVVAAMLAMQLGAVAVVLQTMASGISALPLATFALFMLPIYLAIGLVEGLVTVGISAFIRQARPGALEQVSAQPSGVHSVATVFATAALALGSVGVWYASTAPDGLEWSVARTAGQSAAVAAPTPWHAWMESAQDRTAVMPDYAFSPKPDTPARPGDMTAPTDGAATADSARWGSSAAAVLGSLLTLALAGLVGWALRRLSRPAGPPPA
jgi:cobalt/nickel transport system permease protein